MIDFSKIKSKKEVGKCFDYAILPKQTELSRHSQSAPIPFRSVPAD